jgi:hypothetical protein
MYWTPPDQPNTLRWHDLLPLRDLIDQKTAPIDQDYPLVFGDGPEVIGGSPIETGYTDFSKQRCWVNAELFPRLEPAKAFVVTTFIAAHERAHARWTDFVMSDFELRTPKGDPKHDANGRPLYDRSLQQIWNILEDERIERLLGRDFPHLHRYLQYGSDLMLPKIPVCTGDDDPVDIITWVLRRRVLTRAGKTEPCLLSPANQTLLEEIEPLLDEAFSCDSSRRVVEIAREIMKHLDLTSPPQWITILSGQRGARKPGDAAEAAGATEEDSQLYQAVQLDEVTSEVRELMEGLGYSSDTREKGPIAAAPYTELLRAVMPYVAPLRHLFQAPPSKRSVTYEESGTRLSIRALRRTPQTPFRAETPPERRGNVALTLVIDDSGSMTGARETQAKLTALLCHEALTGPHRVRAVLAPSGRVAADRSLKEMSRAYLAGYDSSSGTEYAAVMAQELALLQKLPASYTKYLILVADGASSNHDVQKCKKIVRSARRKGVHTLGIGIELDTVTAQMFESMFGAQFIDLRSAGELPARMQSILRRVSRNQNHRGVA